MTEYDIRRMEHDRFYDARKPKRYEYSTEEEYKKAYDQWALEWSVNLPNKPGYFRANND